MTFNDLLSIDIKQEINNLIGQQDEDALTLFTQIVKLELLPYSHLEILIDEIPTTNAFKSMCVNSYIYNKSSLLIWLELDKFKNIKDFKRNHTHTDERNINNQVTSNSNGTFNEGYSGYGQGTSEFRTDTTTSDNTNKQTSTEGFNRTQADDDPDLAVRVLRTEIKIRIQQDITQFILSYGRTIS